METVEEGVDYNSLGIPIIDIGPLIGGMENRYAVAAEIGRACREYGFFYTTGHGVDEGLQQRMEQLSRRFFAQDVETKMEIRMARGGRAWRGYFPVGDELTSGQPDLKEGVYFGFSTTPQTIQRRVGAWASIQITGC
jgi:isopenicillin N synthase-like dioxygenase